MTNMLPFMHPDMIRRLQEVRRYKTEDSKQNFYKRFVHWLKTCFR